MDYVAIIERAMQRDLRDRLAAFLQVHEVVEFGLRRRLEFEEAAMVLSCVDDFLVQESFSDLGVAEVSEISKRLGALIDNTKAERSRKIANVCFDALACIKALEARLSFNDARMFALPRARSPTPPSNDR